MTLYMFACTKKAAVLMRDFEDKWKEGHQGDELIGRIKCSSLPEVSMKESVSASVAECFGRADAIVFFAAAGIAVRSIAPCLRHKSSDPAVVVVDETGKFCISLLSGHAGGANALAEQIAALIGATPVITTATDREGRFSVDDFARKHNMAVTDWNLAKEISVAVLVGRKIGVCAGKGFEETAAQMAEQYFEELYLTGNSMGKKAEEKGQSLPDEPSQEDSLGIYIGCDRAVESPFARTLVLAPRILTAGIGCRKNTPVHRIAGALERCFKEEGYCEEALAAVASIDLKAEEQGIIQYCKKKNIPFFTFSAEQLLQIQGEFNDSDFVEQVTGVANVCERSAVAAAEQLSALEGLAPDRQAVMACAAGRLSALEGLASDGQAVMVCAAGWLVCRKRIYDGVTVALAKVGKRK